MNKGLLKTLQSIIFITALTTNGTSQEQVTSYRLEMGPYCGSTMQEDQFAHVRALLSDTADNITRRYKNDTAVTIENLLDSRTDNFEITAITLEREVQNYTVHVKYQDHQGTDARYVMLGLDLEQGNHLQEELSTIEQEAQEVDTILTEPLYQNPQQMKHEIEYLLAVENNEYPDLVANWSPEYAKMIGFENSRVLSEILNETEDITVSYEPQSNSNKDYLLTFTLENGQEVEKQVDSYALSLLHD
jgi:hypothetical protein